MTTISTLLGTGGALGNLIAQKKSGVAVGKAPSVAEVKESLSNDPNLSDGNKQKLAGLADTVNQFAAGNTKLLRDVAGIGTILQLNGNGSANNASSALTNALKQAYQVKSGATTTTASTTADVPDYSALFGNVDLTA